MRRNVGGLVPVAAGKFGGILVQYPPQIDDGAGLHQSGRGPYHLGRDLIERTELIVRAIAARPPGLYVGGQAGRSARESEWVGVPASLAAQTPGCWARLQAQQHHSQGYGMARYDPLHVSLPDRNPDRGHAAIHVQGGAGHVVGIVGG